MRNTADVTGGKPIAVFLNFYFYSFKQGSCLQKKLTKEKRTVNAITAQKNCYIIVLFIYKSSWNYYAMTSKWRAIVCLFKK
jgi:hypothetical protein